jgi:hypothetical protein
MTETAERTLPALKWKPGDKPLKIRDPATGKRVRLLFTEEFAARVTDKDHPDGVKPTTIRWRLSDAYRRQAAGRPVNFPLADAYVRRTTVSPSGWTVTADTPAWLETTVAGYVTTRLGPGGRPRAEDSE